MSCDEFLTDYLQRVVSWVCSQNGFATADSFCLQIGAEFLLHSIRQLAREAKRSAANASRQEVNFIDMQRAVEVINADTCRRIMTNDEYSLLVARPFPRSIEVPRALLGRGVAHTASAGVSATAAIPPSDNIDRITMSSDSWLYYQQTKKDLSEPHTSSTTTTVGAAMGAPPPHIPPHAPMLPLPHTYAPSVTTSGAGGESSWVTTLLGDIPQRKLEDQLNLQVQLPRIMTQIPEVIPSNIREVVGRAAPYNSHPALALSVADGASKASEGQDTGPNAAEAVETIIGVEGSDDDDDVELLDNQLPPETMPKRTKLEPEAFSSDTDADRQNSLTGRRLEAKNECDDWPSSRQRGTDVIHQHTDGWGGGGIQDQTTSSSSSSSTAVSHHQTDERPHATANPATKTEDNLLEDGAHSSHDVVMDGEEEEGKGHGR